MQLTHNKPLVSIGVPVYNDAPWLRNALDHLLAQDYTNLEIILADDGSIDGSREICREYVQRDVRVRLFENKHNLGVLQNHKFVFDVSTGEYFAWGSGHDYYEPVFVCRTLEMMQSNRSMVLCCGRTVREDASGKILSTTTGGLDTRGLLPAKKFGHQLDQRRAGATLNIFYGLYRAEVLAHVKSITLDVDGNDAIMLGELSLIGDLYQIDEISFHRVDTTGRSGGKDGHQEWLKQLGINQKIEKKLIPRLNMINEYLQMIDNSRVSTIEKESLCVEVNKVIEDYRSTIQEEIKQFIACSKAEMLTLEPQTMFRRYRASQVLTTLDHAWLLGFDYEGLHQLRSVCLAGMGLQAEAKAAAREEGKVLRAKNVQRMLKAIRHKTTNGLHKLLGDRS
jgi:hypothetical protein